MGDIQDRVGVLSVRGSTGQAWIIWCAITHDCVVVDGHHAETEVVNQLHERSLHLVARLGTNRVPQAPQGQDRYAGMLAELGLTADGDPMDDVFCVGPVKGWAGSRLMQVGTRIVELDRSSSARMVCRPVLGLNDRTFQVNVQTVTVEFGRLSARVKVLATGPADTVVWAVGNHLFAPHFSGSPIPGYQIHGRAETRHGAIQIRGPIVDVDAWASEIGVEAPMHRGLPEA